MENIESGICLKCGLITKGEYFCYNKCPCCDSSNFRILNQTNREREKRIKKIQKMGKAQYILKEYNVQIDKSLQHKVEEFYAELDKKRREDFKKDIAEINRKARKPDDPRKRGLVECPYCKSKDTEKISTVSRTVSVGLFGLGSKKIGKQWHCNKCKSDF